eukprot:bmy_20076T0
MPVSFPTPMSRPNTTPGCSKAQTGLESGSSVVGLGTWTPERFSDPVRAASWAVAGLGPLAPCIGLPTTRHSQDGLGSLQLTKTLLFMTVLDAQCVTVLSASGCETQTRRGQPLPVYSVLPPPVGP